MTSFRPTEPFDSRHHRAHRFASGNEALDIWLRTYAGQSQRRDAARTFVTTGQDDQLVGYYTLVAAQVEHEGATQAVRRELPRHFPIPVVLIARLAVDRDHQGGGLGRSLLLDALLRIAQAAEEVGIRAVLVHAADEAAAGFYRHFGFEPSGLDETTLMISLDVVRRELLRP